MPAGTTDRTLDARDRLSDALSVVVRLAVRPGAFEQLTERAGIRVERTGFPILGAVEQGPARTSALAASLGVDLSTMSRQVRALEAQDLLTRTPDPDDGRAAVIALTEEGQDVLDRIRSSRRAMMAERVADWDEADVQQLSTLLTRLADRMVEAQTETRPES